MHTILPLFFAGIVGFTHAFEIDHLLAVSSIVTRRNSFVKAMKDGIFWGLGHTSTILAVGMVMLVARYIIAEHTFQYFEAADKVPAFDSVWDGFQTFIRIPAGALLAALALGDADPAWMVAAGLIGGTITAGTHFAKAGSRLAINTSPEPFSNWLASFGEDGLVLGGLWAMLASPVLFLVLLAVFMIVAVLAIRLFARLLAGVFRRI